LIRTWEPNLEICKDYTNKPAQWPFKNPVQAPYAIMSNFLKTASKSIHIIWESSYLGLYDSEEDIRRVTDGDDDDDDELESVHEWLEYEDDGYDSGYESYDSDESDFDPKEDWWADNQDQERNTGYIAGFKDERKRMRREKRQQIRTDNAKNKNANNLAAQIKQVDIGMKNPKYNFTDKELLYLIKLPQALTLYHASVRNFIADETINPRSKFYNAAFLRGFNLNKRLQRKLLLFLSDYLENKDNKIRLYQPRLHGMVHYTKSVSVPKEFVTQIARNMRAASRHLLTDIELENYKIANPTPNLSKVNRKGTVTIRQSEVRNMMDKGKMISAQEFTAKGNFVMSKRDKTAWKSGKTVEKLTQPQVYHNKGADKYRKDEYHKLQALKNKDKRFSNIKKSRTKPSANPHKLASEREFMSALRASAPVMEEEVSHPPAIIKDVSDHVNASDLNGNQGSVTNSDDLENLRSLVYVLPNTITQNFNIDEVAQIIMYCYRKALFLFLLCEGVYSPTGENRYRTRSIRRAYNLQDILCIKNSIEHDSECAITDEEFIILYMRYLFKIRVYNTQNINHEHEDIFQKLHDIIENFSDWFMDMFPEDFNLLFLTSTHNFCVDDGFNERLENLRQQNYESFADVRHAYQLQVEYIQASIATSTQINGNNGSYTGTDDHWKIIVIVLIIAYITILTIYLINDDEFMDGFKKGWNAEIEINQHTLQKFQINELLENEQYDPVQTLNFHKA